MRALKALALGTLATAVLVFAGAAALAVAAQAGASDGLRLAIGPLLLVAVERQGGTSSTTFGAGLLVLALLGGLLNALAAVLLAGRSR